MERLAKSKSSARWSDSTSEPIVSVPTAPLPPGARCARPVVAVILPLTVPEPARVWLFARTKAPWLRPVTSRRAVAPREMVAEEAMLLELVPASASVPALMVVGPV